ncbi:MAG: sodium:proton antiporter [Halioglobus sp.]
MHEELIALITLILVLGIAAQWISWWLKLPSILLLLLIGLVAGPVTGLLEPDAVFGPLLFPMISMGVAVVLFEGALTLKFKDISGHGAVVSNLVSWGAVLNWILITAGTWIFTDLPWLLCLLFGALVVVTGPTVIVPLLRSVRPNPNISNILRWEGILIDPIGALLAVLVFEYIAADVKGGSWLVLVQELGVGSVSGAVAAFGLSILLKRHLIPEYLQNVVTLALVLAVFSIANHFATESGLLAVTVMGVWLANSKGLDIENILTFKESLSTLIISILFITLAARVDLATLLSTGWPALGIIVVILLARAISVWLATLRSEMSWQEKALIAWIAPRGIVAAAVASIFAIKLESLGYAEANLLSALTFMVIIVTVLLQSFTAKPLAKILGVMEEEPRGILIIGANAVSRAIGHALADKGFRVKITGTSWTEIQAARMEGLDTYYGNPVSAHADQHLDLVGIGNLFAMSRRPALNTLACLKYRNEFGPNRTFTLRTSEEKDTSEKNRVNDRYRAPRLFSESITLQKLSSLVGQGAEVKSTRFSESFGWDEYFEEYGKDAIPLFAVDDRQSLKAFTDQQQPEIGPGMTLIALLPKSVTEKLPETAGKIA